MDVGIIGFARGGKTTLFNALTGSSAATGTYHLPGAEPNVAVVKVPDPRVDRLVDLFQPKKIVHATIVYIDVAGIERVEGRSAGAIDEKLLTAVANCDALMAVVRGFEEGGRAVEIEAEVAAIQSELILADLARAETRLERIDKQIGKQSGDVRKKLEAEQALMRRCKEALEAERAIRALDFSPDESRLLRAFQFMTAKPMVIVLNLNEGRMSEAAEWEARARARVAAPATTVVACCARNEMEIARIDDPAERREFMESFEIAEPAADRIIRETYATLGLITFFTAGPKEVHAWTLRKGESIVRAAGTIHSDLERGFISAEVIDVADLVAIGAMAEAKKRGKVRLEGKGYETRDGDVIEVRFSV